jgi:multiple sugar transport system permease protein
MTRKRQILSVVGTHAGLILFMSFLLFPLIWLVVTSLKSTAEIYSGSSNLLPHAISWSHYASVFREEHILQSMWNSLVVGIVATVGSVALALPASYALARYKSALNNAVLGWILGSQIFPAILLVIPLYVILRNLHLTDSLWGLSLVYIVWSLPFVLWMLHGYMKGVPIELEEAALIDGASTSQVLIRILLPILLPAVAASAVFCFVSAWNEFFFALVLLKRPEIITLPVELARYTGIEGQARTGPLAAASVIATIPSLIIFVVMRRWFASGLMAGAVKE